MVQHALGDDKNRPASAALTAVKAYLSNPQITTATNTLAQQLDALTTTMINNAVNQANAAIGRKPASSLRQKEGVAAAEASVKEAIKVCV